LFTKNISIRIVQLALQLLITLAIARLTGPDGNGIFSLFITDVSFFILLLGFCMESTIIYFAAKNKIGLSEIVSLLLPLLIIQTAVFFIVYAVSRFLFHHQFFQVNVDQSGVGWAFLFIFSSIACNYFTAFLSAQKIFFRIIVYNIIVQVLFLAVIVIGHYTHSYFFSIHVLIALYSCIFLVNGIIAGLLAFKSSNEKITLKNPAQIVDKEMLNYTATAYVANILQFFAYRMDIWLMGHFQSKHDTGIYALSAKIAQLWWLVPQFIAMLLFPLTALDDESISGKKFRQYMLYIIVGGSIAALISVWVYPFFIDTIMGSAFNASYLPFLYLLPGVLLFSINILLSARFAGKGNVLINMKASAICFIVILGLDIWLIPMKSAAGAAIASSVGYAAGTSFLIYKYIKWVSK
jgi:O-antigen/teichoic acid export membrane protein